MTVHDTMPAVIGLDHVQAVGTVDESLGSFYDRAIEEAVTDAVSEREIRDWVESELISEHGFRSQALEGPGRSGSEVLLALENAYLIRSDMRRGAQWFELAHDRLVGPVRLSNGAWRTANLSALQIASMAWDRQGRPEALLASGTALAAAGAWAESNPGALLPADADFLDASNQKASRRKRLLAGVAFVLALLAIIGGAVAYRLNEESEKLRAANAVAEENADEANRQQSLAEEQQGLAEEQQGIAEEQQGIAEASTSKAESNEQEADKSARAAEGSAREASVSADEANRQRQIAVEQQGIAEEQQGIAEANAAEATRQRTRSEANAAEATRQRTRAEANAAEANRQRQVAEANAAEAANSAAVAAESATEADRLRVEADRQLDAALIRSACVFNLVRELSTSSGNQINNALDSGDLEAMRVLAQSLTGQLPAYFDPAFACG